MTRIIIATLALGLLAATANAATYYGVFGGNNVVVLDGDTSFWNDQADGLGGNPGSLPVAAASGNPLDGHTYKHINHGVNNRWILFKSAGGNSYFHGSVLEVDNDAGEPRFRWNQTNAVIEGIFRLTGGEVWLDSSGNHQAGTWDFAGGSITSFSTKPSKIVGNITGSTTTDISGQSIHSVLAFAGSADFSGHTGTFNVTQGRIGFDGASTEDASGTTVDLAAGTYNNAGDPLDPLNGERLTRMTIGWGQRNGGGNDGSNNTTKLATLNPSAGELDTLVQLLGVSVDGTHLAAGTYSWQDLVNEGYGDVFGMNIGHSEFNDMGFLSASQIVAGGVVELFDQEGFIHIDIGTIINPNTDVLTIVPEPASLALMGIGGLLLVRRCK